MKTTCKRCKAFEQDEEHLLSSLTEYIESLDKDTKVSQELYEKRLTACESCSSLGNGLCRFCGCFVMVRAIKKTIICPHPEGKKW